MAIETIFENFYDSYTLLPQKTIPSCVVQPPACTLELTGATTVVNVTLRGDSDGSITIYWSGSTGTTSTYIDGVLDGTETGDSHTFTGLSANYYDLLITEGNCFDQVINVQVLDGEFRTGDFIVNEPASLTAVENPIILNLKTARNTGTPQPSKFDIDVDNTVVDGNSLVFNFEYPQAYTATFIAKYFPNRDTYFLASTLKDSTGNNVGTNTNIEIATSIAEVLENDSVISRLYYISSNNTTVSLIAKENTDKLDVATVLTINNTNISYTSQQNGNANYDGAISQDYSLYTDIKVNSNIQYGENPSGSTFNKIAQLELPFNPITNIHFFDLSEVLKNIVSTPKIDFTITGFTTIASMLSGYQIEYGEKYPLVQNSTTKKSKVKGSVDTQYVLNSALSWEDSNDMSDYLGESISNINPDFTLSGVSSAGGSTVDIKVTDYLLVSSATTTTDIYFKFTQTETPAQDSGWQTGNTYQFTGITVGNGLVYISGLTGSIITQYQKSWDAYTPNNAFSFQSFQNSPTQINNISWLTNSPTPKFIQRNSSEFLYLLLSKDYGKTLKIKGDLYFYDGTTLTGETLYTVSTGTTNWGGVFMFAAGYTELQLASYETYSGGTRKIKRVEFGLYQNDALNGDYLLSEEKSYRYEIDEQPRRYGVAFLNKLGTYDIFDFAGEIINSVSHSNESYEVPRPLGQQGNSPFGFQANTVYDTQVVKTIAANTGWIDQDHFDWLIELLESNRCYNYTETDQSFLIVDNVVYSKSSNDDLYQIDVTFKETLFQNNISV